MIDCVAAMVSTGAEGDPEADAGVGAATLVFPATIEAYEGRLEEAAGAGAGAGAGVTTGVGAEGAGPPPLLFAGGSLESGGNDDMLG